MDSEGEKNQVSARSTRTSQVLLRLRTLAWRSGAFMGKMVLRGWIPRASNRGSEQVSYQMMLNGPAGSRTARSNAQLAVDRAHMGVDGKQTQDEVFGDLGAGQSLCQQA
jgi:hypothetical protein